MKIGDKVRIYSNRRPFGDTEATVVKHIWNKVWEIETWNGVKLHMHEDNLTHQAAREN